MCQLHTCAECVAEDHVLGAIEVELLAFEVAIGSVKFPICHSCGGDYMVVVDFETGAEKIIIACDCEY